MSPVLASAITIADDEITIDAERLASMLGLLTDTGYSCLLDLVRTGS